jgi:DNA-directed RNA polymerase subunit K/omega
MPAKKNTKTLYSQTNPVDIASLLTNSNLAQNMDPFLNQTGGKRTNMKETIISKKNKKNKKIDDDDDDDDNNSDVVDESDTDSQYGKGDTNDAEENNDDEEEEEEEVEAEVAVVEEEEENEEEEEEDDGNKSEVSDDDEDKETLDTSNKCYSKYAKEKDNDFDLDEYFKDDDIIITKTGRVGKPILFKYEKVRLLSDRSRQLAEGAKPMIKNTSGLSHKEIALLELKNKLIPLIIERPIPNAGSERWRLSELEIPEYD